MIPPTVEQAAAKLRAGELTPLDLVDACLANIDRFEPQVQAWVLVDAEGARKAAQRLGDELKSGHDRGPLHGMPIGIKDIVDVAGWPTVAGSPLRREHRAETDAALVANLRQAGAIVLGKTVTTQFASFDPPPTRNPWNVERTPGGSSSGSAAAVAMGMCLASVGSQTGGSIIRPASYCGVAGLKPAWGELSVEGVVPLSPLLDHPGAMARSVAGLTAMLAGMRDEPGEPFRARSRPPRLGLFEDFFMTECSPEIRRATNAALDRLQAAGAVVSTIKLPYSFQDVNLMQRRLMAAGAAEYHRRDFAEHRDQYGPNISLLLDEGLAVTPTEFKDVLRHQAVFHRDISSIFERYDALVMPSTTTTAPGIETTGDPRFNAPWSHAGVPTVTIPCGLADDGLPAGLQFIAGESMALLGVAAWCERVVAFDEAPKLLSG